MSSLASKLLEFGLSKEESNLYSLVIQSGSMPISVLEALSGLDKNTLMELLNKLTTKGLLLRVDDRVVPLPPIEVLSSYLYNFLRNYQQIINSMMDKLNQLNVRINKLIEIDFTTILDSRDIIGSLQSIRSEIVINLREFVDKMSVMDNTINEMMSILDDVSRNMSSLEESIKGLSGFQKGFLINKEELQKAIENSLKSEFSEFQSSLETLAISIKTIMESIRDFRNRIISRFSDIFSAIEELDKSIDEFTSNILNTFTTNVGEKMELALTKVLDSIRELREDLQKSQSDIENKLNMTLSAIRKDVEEGYISVVESFSKDLNDLLNKFQNEYKLLIKASGKSLVEPLEKLGELCQNVTERLSLLFNENIKKLNTIPIALEKAINEATKAITSEFLKIYEENMVELAELENQTWVWLSQRILEAADLLIETSDRLRSLHGGLLDQISKRLNILQEYILSLPTKLYSGMDREWRRFLTDSTKRFEELFEEAKEEIKRSGETTMRDLIVLTEDILDAQKKGDSLFKESIEQILNNSLKKAQSMMNSVRDVLLKLKDKVSNNSKNNELAEEITFAIELLEKITNEDLEEELRRGFEYLDNAYSKKDETYKSILNKFTDIVKERIDKLLEFVYEALSKTEKGYLQDLELLMESIKLIYGNQVQALNALINDSLNAIMRTFKETQGKLEEILTLHSDTMVKIFRESTSEIKERIDKFLTDFKLKLEELPKNYEMGISKLAKNTRDVLQGIANNTVGILDEMRKELINGIRESERELNSLEQALTKANNSYLMKLDTIANEVNSLSEELLKGGIKLVNEYLETMIKDLSSQFESILSQYAKLSDILFAKLDEEIDSAVKAGFEKAKDELNRGFSEITERFKKGLEDIVIHIKKYEDAISTINKIEIENATKGVISEISERSYDFTRILSDFSNKFSTTIVDDLSAKLEDLLGKKISELQQRILDSMKIYRQVEGQIKDISDAISKLKNVLNESRVEEVIKILDKMDEDVKSTIKSIETKVQNALKESLSQLKLSDAVNKQELDQIFAGINRVYMTLISLKNELKATSEKLMEKLSITTDSKVIDESLKSIIMNKSRRINIYIGYSDNVLLNFLKQRGITTNIRIKVAETLATRMSAELNIKRVDKGNIYNIIVLIVDGREAYIIKKKQTLRELIYIADKDLSEALEKTLF